MNDKRKKKGKFIVFEGIDGSGSSTQADLLYQYFLSRGQTAVLSPEPTSGKIGKLLRNFLAHNDSFNNQELYDQQMAYLFAADRHYHLYNDFDGVLKLTQNNTHVITTRYYFSSLAYNSKNEQEFAFVRLLNQAFPPPDYLIYCDLPVDIALQRISDRSSKEIYETSEKLTKVRSNFYKILHGYQYSYLQIDARENKEQIHQKIVEYINHN